MAADSDIHDWENMLWFLVAHNLRIDDAHERGLDDLRSTIETVDTELAALTESFITICSQKRAFREKSGGLDYKADPKWKLLNHELGRLVERFKERINSLS